MAEHANTSRAHLLHNQCVTKEQAIAIEKCIRTLKFVKFGSLFFLLGGVFAVVCLVRNRLTDRDSTGIFTEMSEVLNNKLESLKNYELFTRMSKTFNNKLEILQNFELDKTGRTDLALYNSGGRIAGIGEDTELFYSCNFLWKLLGCPNKRNGPEKIIKPAMHLGHCFRFKGKKASVIIRLARKAILDAVTVEHITKRMSPTGEVKSAPRIFSVSAMNGQYEDPFQFGTFEFEANRTSIETFWLPKRAPIPHKYVKIGFIDNNGHQNETCVYRVRVHGVVDQN